MTLVDLSSTTFTQSAFGELVGIGQPAVSALKAAGVLADGDTLGGWLLAYCHRLRETAAGRQAEGGLDLATERARLAREQADKIAMQNAVSRKELAPAYLLEDVLAKAGSKVGRILDTIPGELRRRVPTLTAEDVTTVAATIAKARNIAASMTHADLTSDADDDATETAADDIADADIEATIA